MKSAKRTAYRVGLAAYRYYRLYSSPERVRMRGSVRRWLGQCPTGARVLEIGGGTSMLRGMVRREIPRARYVSGDIAPTDRTDAVMDALALPVADGCIDVAIALEVLEHVPHPARMLAEAGRVLGERGLLILTTPFMFGLHDYRDYFRYTPRGLEELLAGTGLVLTDVVLRGGTFVSASGLVRNRVRDAVVGSPGGWRSHGTKKKVLWVAATLVTLPWVPVMWLSMVADRLVDRSSKSPPGFFFLCQKS